MDSINKNENKDNKAEEKAKPVNKKAQKAKDAKGEITDAILEDEKDSKTDSHDSFRKAGEESIAGNSTPNENVSSSANVNLDDNKDESNHASVDFMNDDYMENLLRGKTKQSEEKIEGKETPYEDKKNETKSTLSSDPPTADLAFSEQDMYDFAEVFMDIIDMGISTALKFYSKDTSITAYELEANKKKRLIRQLSKILMKHQIKFPLEAMFIVTLIICYSVPIAKARKTRREIMDGTFKREGGKPSKG
jgi:hypothetical protein